MANLEALVNEVLDLLSPMIVLILQHTTALYSFRVFPRNIYVCMRLILSLTWLVLLNMKKILVWHGHLQSLIPLLIRDAASFYFIFYIVNSYVLHL